MLAMYHDYRVGPGPTGKGYLCLNELDFGAPLKPAMSSVFRQKLGHATYRTLVLEARRFTGPQALEAGILDAVSSPAFATTAAGPGAGGAGAGTAGWEAVMQLVRERGLIGKGRTGVYGLMKMEMYRESLAYLEGHEREDERDRRLVQGEKKRREEGVRRAQAVKAQITKTASKL